MKYSGSQVTRAGKILAAQKIESASDFEHAMDVLSQWRFCHEGPLNNALSLLKEVVAPIDRTAIFAKRLKRFASIQKKLLRFEDMTLRNMQDIGGCRAVVSTEKKLWQSIRELRRKPEFKTEKGTIRFKDYIKKPKDSGYRSYHLIGRFSSGKEPPRNIEFQIRTKNQHYWATAVEIVDLFTGQALKSNRGEAKWREFFMEIGNLFSIIDGIHIFDTLPFADKKKKFKQQIDRSAQAFASYKRTLALAKSLEVEEVLEAFAGSIHVVNERLNIERKIGYFLLSINIKKHKLNSNFFQESDGDKARDAYIHAEKAAAIDDNAVVALVSSTALGGIKEAYPNFFADSSQFLLRLLFFMEIE